MLKGFFLCMFMLLTQSTKYSNKSPHFYAMDTKEYLSLKDELGHIIQRLGRLENMIRGLPVKSNENLGDWLTEVQAQELLSYKTTSLWGLRRSKKIGYSKINGKIFYSRMSILNFLEKNSCK